MGNETTIAKLSKFIYETKFEDLPAEVVVETKRLLLDSVGCALAGTASDKGRLALRFVRQCFGFPRQATVFGFGDKISVIGASFVNGELINALDYDAILPPGHVSPFVIPSLMAVAEAEGASGEELITACAMGHEISHRMGRGLSGYRDIIDGRIVWPLVSGYSCCVFGGVGAIGRIKHFCERELANALGLAGQIAPMQAMTAWVKNPHSTTAKYLLAGCIAQAELTAASLVEVGYSGDISILDGDYGFWRYAGSPKWNAAPVVEGLGKTWHFPLVTSYKHFPACQIIAGGLNCLSHIIEKEALKPDEIQSIKAYLETNVAEPALQTRELKSQIDAQFNVAYTLSLVAHRVKPGPQWQSIDNLTNQEILKFMGKISYEPHPGFVKTLEEDPRSRLAKVEVIARGKKFVEERKYSKGTPSPDASTYMTNDELMAKFKDNASYILPSNKVHEAATAFLNLEKVAGIREIMKLVSI
jgi:2-methylcitrate dehydratase PrpD